ncbi:MAG: hypothetical protein ACTHJ0_10740 [Flavipsychrobacter sp.]
MKKLFILFAIIPTFCLAQVTQDNVAVSTNTPLIFSYGSIDELQIPKIIQNAIELKLTPKNYSRNVMASISYVGVSQNEIPVDWLSLKLASKSSINATIYKVQNPLSSSPVLLFIQPPSPSNQDLTFNYDLILSPLHTFINTGNFTFNIVISITQS